MTIHTQESLSGFIATDPQLSFTSKGEAKFYARIGQEHFTKNDDGSFTAADPTFHDLVMYRRSAERAFAQFAKGDSFVAEGYVHAYNYERDGRTIDGEEFVAKRLGHDVARVQYEVDRNHGRDPIDQAPAQKEASREETRAARRATAPGNSISM